MNVVGDPGLGEYNVGHSFEYAAVTHAAVYEAAGNTVAIDRISSVMDFASSLMTHGLITGGVAYLGHAGQGIPSAPYTISMLFAGETSAEGSNISEYNVDQLSNAQLAPTVTITLYGCDAARRPFYRPAGPSVAQALANRLQRTVLAWKVGLFLSTTTTPRNYLQAVIQGTTIHMIPVGGLGVKPCVFRPGQAEPVNCGGGS